MRIQLKHLLFCLALFFLLTTLCPAAEKENGPDTKPAGPPALVEVARVSKGEAEPMVEFVGTVYYARKSRVAAEVDGVVEKVFFEEGYRVKKDESLVRLESEILDTVISGTRADYEQVLVELEQAEKELKRREPLYKEGSVSESAYDEYYFKTKTLQSRARAIKASLDKLLLEKKKKIILAPFGGLVIQKNAEKGEWIDAGGTVAVVADDSTVDIVVNVPGGMLKYLHPGKELAIRTDNGRFTGKFLSFVPKGDVATRTFDVKIRLQNTANLVEGMEARAMVPAEEKIEGLMVPRDAVIDRFGQNVIWLVRDSAAKMVPVQIAGYAGMSVGVTGPDLTDGDTVVIKGNERLREGQPVMIGNK
jgi:RND family efflux transporter MFP subunit